MRFWYFFLDKSITSLKVRKTLTPYGQSKDGNPLVTSQRLKRLVASASAAHACRSTLAPMASIGHWKLTFPNGKVTPGDIYRKHVLSIFVVLRITLQKQNGRVFSLKPTEMLLLIFPLWLSVKTQNRANCHFDTPTAMHFFWGPHTVVEAKSRAGREIPGQPKQAVSKQPRIRWLKLAASH